MTEIEKKGLSRRNFVKGSALAALGVATGGLLAGCAEKTDAAQASADTTSADWLGKAPVIADSKINKTLKADVVIVGAGVAGMFAARAASEAGASVIVVEKADTYQVRSGQYGVIDSKIQKSLGVKVDKNAAINENMKQMGYRADYRMWKYWADHSGEDYDWLLELAPDYNLLTEDALSLDVNKINIQPAHFPVPEGYDPAEEYNPSYPTVLSFLPSQKKIIERVYKKCVQQKCKFIYKTWVKTLIRPDKKGRIEGIICQDIKGNYTKILCNKGVILATGDYGNNKDMVSHFVPWAAHYFNIYPSVDANAKPANTGDGHKMGVWIGAKMEDGPHAPMAHTLGGPLGCDAFFLANTEGERFINEDAGGQQLSNALYRQPGYFGWQIFDDKWPEQIGHMGVSHGTVNHCVDDDKLPNLQDSSWTLGRTSITSRKQVRETAGIVIANSLEELVSKMELTKGAQAKLLASIKRYNEQCNKGVDEDFGKVAKRMFPIVKAPFYAGKMTGAPMLVNMGGLTCDPESGNVIDTDFKGIEGLYAAGNVMGGRFLGDYPTVTAGTSHAFALTYGRLVGKTVAKL